MDQESRKSQKHTVEELNRIYQDGESCDKELFAEQRSNILLSSGEHFSKKNSQWWNRIRDSKSLSNDQKIRIQKNHIWKVTRSYVNNITSMAPGVTPSPNDPKDLQHVKTAELNKSVWEHAKQTQNLRQKVQSWAKDFIEIGEVFTEIFWDETAGKFVGHEQELEDDGTPMIDEMGQPVASDRPVFSGDLVFKKHLPANIIRASEAKTIEEAAWLCIREMVPIQDLKMMIGKDEEKEKWLQEGDDKTFFVFDANKGNYGKSKNQCLVKKFYFRPCPQYPEGYYFVSVEEGILFEGALPFSVYPLVYGGFDEISSTPRHRSIIKQLRPIQIEINRAASKIAETSISLGDDKIIMQNGSKCTTGPGLPGIRTLSVTGQAPTILPGRTGEQHGAGMQALISELYMIANVAEDSQENPAAADPWANLFRSIRDKKKFSLYAEKFETFLIKVCETYLELAKNYFDEQTLIPAIGKSEYLNIAEFKNQDPLSTRVKLEAQTEDINTLMGRTLVFNHILQYCSGQLQKDDIGKILRDMPFANNEDAWDDFTLDYDTSTNIVLALDRGQPVQPQKNDNAEYILKRLGARQKKADYRLLNPQIQMAYDQLINQYESIMAQQAQTLKQAESEFIPSGGALIAADYYINDPSSTTGKTMRVRIPAEAVDWLVKQLAAQGSAQEQLQQQPPGVQNDLARMIAQQPGQAGPTQARTPQMNQPVSQASAWSAMQGPHPGGIQ